MYLNENPTGGLLMGTWHKLFVAISHSKFGHRRCSYISFFLSRRKWARGAVCIMRKPFYVTFYEVWVNLICKCKNIRDFTLQWWLLGGSNDWTSISFTRLSTFLTHTWAEWDGRMRCARSSYIIKSFDGHKPNTVLVCIYIWSWIGNISSVGRVFL